MGLLLPKTRAYGSIIAENHTAADLIPGYLERPAIAHFVNPSLFLTSIWIDTQLVNMTSFRPLVLTARLENQNEFPSSHIHFESPPNPLWVVAFCNAFEAISRSHASLFITSIHAKPIKLLSASERSHQANPIMDPHKKSDMDKLVTCLFLSPTRGDNPKRSTNGYH
jgi:hypothetical protein